MRRATRSQKKRKKRKKKMKKKTNIYIRELKMSERRWTEEKVRADGKKKKKRMH